MSRIFSSAEPAPQLTWTAMVANKDGSDPRKLVSVPMADNNVSGPSIAPDGKHIVFETTVGERCALDEIAADGTGLRTIVTTGPDECLGTPVWSSDSMHIIYFLNRGVASSDLWALPMQAGLFNKAREPVRLTNGPLAYSGPCPSRDGKQIFAIGTKRRGELVRYDMKSQQFVPFLPGTSAIAPTFSRDGQWVAYISYPDHTLWRSRSDGTDRRQLTYPPIQVRFPSISPDGTKAAFSTPQGETYVVSMDGGQPQRIVEKNSAGASWSPDGDRLITTSWSPEGNAEGSGYSLQIFDLTTQKMSSVPSSQGLFAGYWATQDLLVASNASQTKFLTFDVKSQKWSDLATGHFSSFTVSPDHKYLYYMFAGVDLTVYRIRFSDRQVETVASLKGLRRVMDPVQGEADMNFAPDGSLIFTRDIGTQEIYALTIKWP